MSISLILIMDLVGTIAFAISGAVVAIEKKMDIFGVNILAVIAATGGGMIRDIIIGNTPPVMFRNPVYVLIAAVTANVVFVIVRLHRDVPRSMVHVYELFLFWFDTIGLAAFTVDGVLMGARSAHGNNLFLVVFLGVVTGVGGGLLRDLLAGRTPYIFVKHIYALASIAGALAAALLSTGAGSTAAGALVGAGVVILIRCLAAHYRWDLPKA